MKSEWLSGPVHSNFIIKYSKLNRFVTTGFCFWIMIENRKILPVDDEPDIIELSLKDGSVDGPVTLYFDSGQISEIRTYDQGKMDGTWSTFNTKGIKIGVANYKDTIKHGDWFIRDDAGTLRFIIPMERKPGPVNV